MYQRDYILKMVEMMGRFVTAILNHIANGNYREAEDLIAESYHTLLNEDAALFTFIPNEQLTESLIAEHHFENGHLEIIAQLFKVEAQLREAQKNHSLSLQFYEKSLLIYTFLEKESPTFSLQRNTDIEYLKNKTAELANPKNTSAI